MTDSLVHDSEAHDTIDVQTLTLMAANGEPIAASRFAQREADTASHRHDAPTTDRDVVIISAAMATRASFYAKFARWLATQGFVVYTYDYQGYGASMRPGTTLKDTKATMFDWMSDAALMLEHVSQHEGRGSRLHWLGQSLGGQVLPFTDTSKLTSATIVASGTGSMSKSVGVQRLITPVFWYVMAPLLTRMYGYYPGTRYKILGDLPATLMRQWGSWCRSRRYMFKQNPEFAAAYAAVRVPMTSISFSDDETMSAAATAELESWYSGAPLRKMRFTPAELGRKHIGHIGIFRASNAAAWPIAFAHLLNER